MFSIPLKFLNYEETFAYLKLFLVKKPKRYLFLLSYLYKFFYLKSVLVKPFKLRYSRVFKFVRVILKRIRFKYLFYKTKFFTSISSKKKSVLKLRPFISYSYNSIYRCIPKKWYYRNCRSSFSNLYLHEIKYTGVLCLYNTRTIKKHPFLSKKLIKSKLIRFRIVKKRPFRNVYSFMRLSYMKLTKITSSVKRRWSLFVYFNDLLRYNLRKSYPFYISLRKRKSHYSRVFKSYGSPIFIRYLKIFAKTIIFNQPMLLKNDNNFRKKMVTNNQIKRIKFKPGYIIMWKKARKNLQLMLGLKFKYQHRLTRFILNKKDRSYRSFINCFVSLLFLIKKLNFFKSSEASLLLFEFKLVMVNGSNVPSPSFLLAKGDIISLVVFLNYYLFFFIDRFIYNLKRSKIKKWFNYAFKRHKFQFFKTRKTAFSKKFVSYNDFYSDISFIFETDYISLSAIFIINPIFLQHLHKQKFQFDPVNIYNMYNWKYIN